MPCRYSHGYAKTSWNMAECSVGLIFVKQPDSLNLLKIVFLLTTLGGDGGVWKTLDEIHTFFFLMTTSLKYAGCGMIVKNIPPKPPNIPKYTHLYWYIPKIYQNYYTNIDLYAICGWNKIAYKNISFLREGAKNILTCLKICHNFQGSPLQCVTNI